MKKYLISFLVLYSSLLFGSSQLMAKPQQTILVFGDSLSAAYNIPTEKGWVSLLQDFFNQKNMPIKVINASISGETTGGGLLRLEKQLQLHQPNIVILELGGNDGLRGLDLVTTRDNLTQMVEMSRQHSSKVLLAGIRIPPNYGRTYTQRFTAIYDDLAKLQDVALIPFILEQVATKDEFMQGDGIHPNEKAQPLIVETVREYLSPLLTEKSN